MGQPFFICEMGTGREIPPDARLQLDRFISSLPEFDRWGHGQEVARGKRFTLCYHMGYLEIVVDSLEPQERQELRALVAFCRTIGLSLFVDIGDPEDEMDLEDIENMLGPMT